jgi:hypothetical protein
MPFTLSEGQRKAMQRRMALQGRLILQPPANGQMLPDMKRIQGLPLDVLVTLESLRQLAEAGNIVAGDLYASERRRLGIDVPRHFFPGSPNGEG